MNRIFGQLVQTLGREPKPVEIAEVMETTQLKVERLQTAYLRPVSLDAPLSNDDGESYTRGDFIEDSSAVSPDEQADLASLGQQLNGMLNKLKPIQAVVLRWRFGLENGRCRTLEEIAKELGKSRERVRQIEEVALRILNTADNRAKLDEYLG